MKAIVLSVMLSAPAHAYVSSEGHEYAAKCTSQGMTLESNHPIVRIIENGANTKRVGGIERIRMEPDCSAYTEVFGYGKWMWANGGFWISFPAYEIRFPRQEVFCVEGETDPFNEALQCGAR